MVNFCAPKLLPTAPQCTAPCSTRAHWHLPHGSTGTITVSVNTSTEIAVDPTCSTMARRNEFTLRASRNSTALIPHSKGARRRYEIDQLADTVTVSTRDVQGRPPGGGVSTTEVNDLVALYRSTSPTLWDAYHRIGDELGWSPDTIRDHHTHQGPRTRTINLDL